MWDFQDVNFHKAKQLLELTIYDEVEAGPAGDNQHK